MKNICVNIKQDSREVDNLIVINNVITKEICLQGKDVSIFIKHDKAIDLANKIIDSVQGDW